MKGVGATGFGHDSTADDVTDGLDQLADSGRVVMLSSSLHTAAPSEGIQFGNLSGEKGYAPWTAHGQSKLANLLFAKHLATRLPGAGQQALSIIDTAGISSSIELSSRHPLGRVRVDQQGGVESLGSDYS